MSTAAFSAPSAPRQQLRASGSFRPQPRKWTCKEFHQLGDMGWFEGRRAMLIEGEILEMPGPNPPHATSTTLTDTILRSIFGAAVVVRNQLPLILGLQTDPEPDLAVVPGNVRDYAAAHPTSAVLIVEISDSTLDYDLNDKASLYAAGGITDYWVVDLVNRRLIIHRVPQSDPAAIFGARYSQITQFAPSDHVSPLSVPQAAITVADLLP
jgi:Uma2 family endonuclease